MRPMTPKLKKQFLIYPRWRTRAKAGGRAAINRKFSRRLMVKLDLGELPMRGSRDEKD